MDPNAALENIQALLVELERLADDAPDDSPLANTASELVDVLSGLDGWLRRGGFLPADWKSANRFELSPEDLSDLSDTLSDAYAYRVGEGDPHDEDDPDIWESDRENMAKAVRLMKLFGVKHY